MSMLRLHRDAALTVVGLDALAEVMAGADAEPNCAKATAAAPIAATSLGTSVSDWARWLRRLVDHFFGC